VRVLGHQEELVFREINFFFLNLRNFFPYILTRSLNFLKTIFAVFVIISHLSFISDNLSLKYNYRLLCNCSPFVPHPIFRVTDKLREFLTPLGRMLICSEPGFTKINKAKKL
jgi:hypothetical protein